MEQFDLVNEKDEVIGVTTKDKSHKDGGIHRVAAIFVFDKEGKLYVQEHLSSGGKLDHSVGGHVDKGESYDDAAKREGFEELGITDPLEKVSIFYSDETFSGSKRHFFGLYECHPSEKWQFKPNDEVKNIIPMSIKEIVELMNREPYRFTGGFRNTMREYLRIKKLSFTLSEHVFERKVFFYNTKGDKLVGVLSDPTKDKTKPIILFAHGHSSSKYTKNFVRLTEILNRKDISTFRIDLYGHGESEGAFENGTVSEAADSILSAITYLKEQGYTKIGLIGSSFGGISSTMAASKTNDLFLLVLKSPVSNYSDLYKYRNTPIEKWKQQGYKDYRTKKGMLKLNYIFYEDSLQNDGYKVAPTITIPTLIVHGDADKEVPLEQSIKLSKLIPNCKLEIVYGSDHVYTQPEQRELMLRYVSDFIFNHI